MQDADREGKVDALVGEREAHAVEGRVVGWRIRRSRPLDALSGDVDAVEPPDLLHEERVGQSDAATDIEHTLLAKRPEQACAQRRASVGPCALWCTRGRSFANAIDASTSS